MKVTLSIFKRRERRGGPRQAVKKKISKETFMQITAQRLIIKNIPFEN